MVAQAVSVEVPVLVVNLDGACACDQLLVVASGEFFARPLVALLRLAAVEFRRGTR